MRLHIQRRWILWLLMVVFVWLVIARFAEISRLWEVLSSGSLGWVVVAAFLQGMFYIAYSGLYKVVFSAVLVHSKLRDLLPVVFASVFVNVAVPTGGTSGVALFIDNATRRGQSAARTAAGVLLALTVDFTTFTGFLGFGLTDLALRNSLFAYELTAAAVLLFIIGSMSIALLLSLWKPWMLLYVLHKVQYVVNKVAGWVKLTALPESWAATHAMDFSAASIAVAEDPWKLSRAFLLSLTGHCINLASLYVLFLAFHYPIGIGMLVAGFAVGNLFWIVSLTPQGVGVVEGVMTLVYTSLGVPVATAAAIVLAYRGLGFWLPMGIGFVLIHRIRSFRGIEAIGA